MFTMDRISPPVRTRQQYSREFKSQVIAQARQPHVSIASVALSHGLNANLLRKWIKEADPNYVGKHRQSSPRIIDTGSSPKFDSSAYFSLISTLGMLLNQWVSEAA